MVLPLTARPLTAQREALTELDDRELLRMVRALPREILIGRYQKLVRSCVRPYQSSPESAEELMQVGYVGLLKAINNFDPDFGGNLASYAHPCVNGEIKRHFRDKRWQVQVRRWAVELVVQVRSASEALTQQLGRTPSVSELAAHLGIGPE